MSRATFPEHGTYAPPDRGIIEACFCPRLYHYFQTSRELLAMWLRGDTFEV